MLRYLLYLIWWPKRKNNNYKVCECGHDKCYHGPQYSEKIRNDIPMGCHYIPTLQDYCECVNYTPKHPVLTQEESKLLEEDSHSASQDYGM
jgi:hypothetical protein